MIECMKNMALKYQQKQILKENNNMKIVTKTEQECSLEDLRKIIRRGDVAEFLKTGDSLWLKFDSEETQFDIIGINAEKNIDHCITIQMHNLIEERPFDTTGDFGSDVWETSGLRKYLNSTEFASRFEDLTNYITQVEKENSNGKTTKDLFFLPSVDELAPEKTPYEYYKNLANRVKTDKDGFVDWYWTRSARRGNSCYAWYVNSTGRVYVSCAMYAYRCAPACVIC